MKKGDGSIDSRDVIERIEELKEERQTIQDGIENCEDAEEKLELIQDLCMWNTEYGDEFTELLDLQEQCDHVVDWTYGEILIHENDFMEYAQQLADDIGNISNDWPCRHIDWDAACKELKMDYREVNFGGECYWIRD